MERLKKKCLICVIAIAIVAFGKASKALEKYEIVLNDGRKIETLNYWEDQDKVFYQKYGSSIGISKAEVAEIKLVQVEQNDTQDSFDSNEQKHSSWDQDNAKQKRNLQASLTKCEKKLAKIKNRTMAEWKKGQDHFNKANKKHLSLDEYMDKNIGFQERQCEKIRERIANVGVLDLAEIDLGKYTSKAKAERKEKIKNQKEIIRDFQQQCINNKRYCNKARDAEQELSRLIKEQAQLEKVELAFSEKLSISLEEEANKNAF